MALVKYGGGVVQMSGSIAGNTFARNRYGNYVRSRTKPTNPNTAAQQAVRSSLAALTTRWSQTLTAAQRTAWNLYGSSVSMTNKLGETMNLSGFNHYIRSNSYLARAAGTIVDAGPTTFEIPEADPTLTVTGSEATQDLTTTYDDGLAWATEAGGFLLCYQGTPQNAQRNFFAGPWKYLDAQAGVDAAPPAGPLVSAAVSVITEAQRQWIYCRILRVDGRLSAPFRADNFIAA